MRERASQRTDTVFSRQLDIVPQDKLIDQPFTIIGAGSLGSHTTHILAQMGAENIVVYDHDEVDDHNLGVQFFDAQSVGSKKVAALKRLISQCHEVEIVDKAEKVTEENVETALRGIVIAAVDNMNARKLIWEKVHLNPMVELYIDTRAARQVCSIFTLNPMDLAVGKEYNYHHLFPESEGAPGPCTEKMTTFNGPQTASHVASLVVNYLKNEPLPFQLDIDMRNHIVMKYEFDGKVARLVSGSPC
jgi:molybdopterin/thiamine biosynthesis adenylyltransferase